MLSFFLLVSLFTLMTPHDNIGSFNCLGYKSTGFGYPFTSIEYLGLSNNPAYYRFIAPSPFGQNKFISIVGFGFYINFISIIKNLFIYTFYYLFCFIIYTILSLKHFFVKQANMVQLCACNNQSDLIIINSVYVCEDCKGKILQELIEDVD